MNKDDSRYCTVCEKQLTRKRRADGYLEGWSNFFKRETCPGECSSINKSIKMKEAKELFIEDPDRFCIVCEGAIPHRYPCGTHIRKAIYESKQTCGNKSCKSENRRVINPIVKKQKIIKIRLTAIDLFNAGRWAEVIS